MLWFSAAFTAFLVVTVVGLGFWFLPHMFTPPPREPDFEDVDEDARLFGLPVVTDLAMDEPADVPVLGDWSHLFSRRHRRSRRQPWWQR